MTRVYRLALATVLATLSLVVLGSLARLQPAGSGCGNDWPRCNGSWLPPLAWEPLVEYGHRGVALTVIILATATAIVAFRTPRETRRVRVLASAGIGTILFQSVVGGLTALWGAPPGIAIVHLAMAMVFLAFAFGTLAASASIQGSPAWLAQIGRAPSRLADRPFAIVATLGAGIAFFLVLFGASTSATGSFACATWPICLEGQRPESAGVIHLGYRATALFGTVAAAGAALLAWRRRASPPSRHLALTAVGLVVVQSGLNTVSASIGDPAWMSAPHLPVAALFWVAMLGVAAAAWSPRPLPRTSAHRGAAPSSRGAPLHLDPSSPASSAAAVAMAANPALGLDLASPLARAGRIAADYVALTKPGIMSLLLTTTFCAMLIAARGIPPFWLVAVTLLGGVFASGGANVLNCFIDRDIDGQMARTRNRAIVAGRVSADAALAFGVTLSAAAVLLLGLAVNWAAAALALAGNLYYVLIYSKWLKRATPYNIVIGGGAGAVPPLVGWAAVTGDLSPLAWGLFAIVFAWTPPHFWALALLKQGEYTRAAVPMLPVVRGEAETRRQIVLYTVVLAVVCLALIPFGLGGIYLVSTLILNGIFLFFAVRLSLQPSKRVARQMFFYSLWYLALLFAAAVADRMIIT